MNFRTRIRRALIASHLVISHVAGTASDLHVEPWCVEPKLRMSITVATTEGALRSVVDPRSVLQPGYVVKSLRWTGVKECVKRSVAVPIVATEDLTVVAVFMPFHTVIGSIIVWISLPPMIVPVVGNLHGWKTAVS